MVKKGRCIEEKSLHKFHYFFFGFFLPLAFFFAATFLDAGSAI
jgi:hypothetical protein